jgi:hypothetical protein
MNMMLLEALAWGKVKVALNFIDLQVTVHLAALLLLGLHLSGPSLPVTLLDSLRGIKGPALLPVGLPHVLTGVTASIQ